jgi:hypothetical protein
MYCVCQHDLGMVLIHRDLTDFGSGRYTDFPVFLYIRGPVHSLNHQEELIDHDSYTESEQKDVDLATTTDV